jgi:DNA primase
VQQYNKSLPKAEEYLSQRGLTLEDAQAFWMGVVEEPLPGHEQFVGRLAIPYLTPTGVVDLRFRSLRNEEPKYLGLPGAETTMFNVAALFAAKSYICVCEGEMDTIIMSTKTAHPTVGVPGAQAWKPHYTRLLEDFEHVIVLADGDAAGSAFAQKILRELSAVKIVSMPEDNDVNSTYLKNGKEFIDERINFALGR